VYLFTYVSANQWGTGLRTKDVIKSNDALLGEREKMK
jgi:hypothetical protein